jgi:hypothetical protein
MNVNNKAAEKRLYLINGFITGHPEHCPRDFILLKVSHLSFRALVEKSYTAYH